MTFRLPRPTCLPALAALALFTLATPALAEHSVDWLDIRRHGADAVLTLGREQTAGSGWTRTYRADVKAGTPLAGLKIQVSRHYAAGKTQFALRVVAGPGAVLGMGAVVDGDKGWIRYPGEKTKPLPQETVFRPLPLLEVPLVTFFAMDWQGQYSPTLEGEFDQVAVVRLMPRYELGVTARPAKASISKRDGRLLATGVNDGKGAPLGEVVWMYAPGAPTATPSDMEMHGPGGQQGKVTKFVADGPATPAAKGVFAPSYLK